MQVNRLQLQSSSSSTPGDQGFKLIGECAEQPGKLARVWVRRKRGGQRHVWHRYLDPVAASAQWEVRLHVSRGTGAMTLTPFSMDALEALSNSHGFPKGARGRAALEALDVDDPLFQSVREWALRVTAA